MNSVKLEELLRYNFEGDTEYQLWDFCSNERIFRALDINIRFESPIPESQIKNNNLGSEKSGTALAVPAVSGCAAPA